MSTISHDCDLLVIGGGSGGVAAARYAAAQGARVVLCESDRLGGTCVLRGCVPKKIFMYGAQFADAFEDARGYGWSFDAPPRFDLAALTGAKNAETTRLEGIYAGMLDKAGVRVIHARARLLDAHTVEAGGERIRAQRLLIATGGAPRQPKIEGIELALTSTGVLELTEAPRQLLVLGSGYIGCEFAGIYRGFGSGVTLAMRGELPLRGFDDDLRSRLAVAMQARGVQLATGFKPVRLQREGAQILCHGEDGCVLRADAVLNALGRAPNTQGLGLEAAGVQLGEQGQVRVDEYSRSNVPHIFAVGDVTDRLNLTPVAIAEARAFVDSEFRARPRRIDHTLVASAVFSQPQLAQVGLTESAARERGHAVQVFEADFRPMKHVLAGRAERSYMKLLVDVDSQRVLGVHMLGADAAEIVQSLAVAVTMGASKRDFDATLALHPSAAEEFMLMRTPRA